MRHKHKRLLGVGIYTQTTKGLLSYCASLSPPLPHFMGYVCVTKPPLPSSNQTRPSPYKSSREKNIVLSTQEKKEERREKRIEEKKERKSVCDIDR